jgi:hypothetical protein
MASRTIVPVLFLVFLLQTLCFDQASRADDCLSGPTGVSPQGTHWYYRVDRATGRHCWYLGALGTKARVPADRVPADKVRQAAPTQRPASVKSRAPVQTMIEPAEDDAAPAEISPVETRPSSPERTLSTQWQAGPVASANRELPSAINSYAEEEPVADPPEEMPLIWPVLTAADMRAVELPAAGPAAQSGTTFGRVAALIATVLGLVAVIIWSLAGRSRNADAKPARRNRSGMVIRRNSRGGHVPAVTQAATQLSSSLRQAPRTNAHPSGIDGNVEQLIAELRRRHAFAA